MSISAREQQVLDSIKDRLADSDPGLAALLATFSRLASGEQMPPRENILRACRSSSSRRWHPRRCGGRRRAPRACPRLAFLPAATQLLLWLLITIVPVAIVLALSHGGSRSACTAPVAAVCAQSTPALASRPPAHQKGTSHVRQHRPARAAAGGARRRPRPGSCDRCVSDGR